MHSTPARVRRGQQVCLPMAWQAASRSSGNSARTQQSHAAALQSMTINEAKLAGKRAGAKAAKDAAESTLMELLMPDIQKMCEEVGKDV